MILNQFVDIILNTLYKNVFRQIFLEFIIIVIIIFITFGGSLFGKERLKKSFNIFFFYPTKNLIII